MKGSTKLIFIIAIIIAVFLAVFIPSYLLSKKNKEQQPTKSEGLGIYTACYQGGTCNGKCFTGSYGYDCGGKNITECCAPPNDSSTNTCGLSCTGGSLVINYTVKVTGLVNDTCSKSKTVTCPTQSGGGGGGGGGEGLVKFYTETNFQGDEYSYDVGQYVNIPSKFYSIKIPEGYKVFLATPKEILNNSVFYNDISDLGLWDLPNSIEGIQITKSTDKTGHLCNAYSKCIAAYNNSPNPGGQLI